MTSTEARVDAEPANTEVAQAKPTNDKWAYAEKIFAMPSGDRIDVELEFLIEWFTEVYRVTSANQY